MRLRRIGISIMLTLSTLGIAQQTLVNDEIIKMHESGLGDDLLVSIIGSQPGSYTLTSDSLVTLKKAGISDKVVAAMLTKGRTSTQPATDVSTPLTSGDQSPAHPLGDQPKGNQKPRVFLQSVSSGNNLNARRDQSMEMGKDFEKDCSGVRISINQQVADYTVVFNNIEQGFIRDNQIQIADRNGDLLTKTKEGGSIAGAVKKACVLILTDWAKNRPSTP